MDNAHAFENGEGLVLGTDFGSSNSCVAVWRADKNKVKIIKNSSTFGNAVSEHLIQIHYNIFTRFRIMCFSFKDNTLFDSVQ